MAHIWTWIDDTDLPQIAEGPLLDRVLSRLYEQTQPELSTKYIEGAQRLHQVDGEVEIDDDACVSISDGGGAYVQAWVWLYAEDVGLPGLDESEVAQ